MSSFFRTSVRPVMQRLSNDERMSEEDHLTLSNLLVVLRTRLPTVFLSGAPQHHEMHYVALFEGLPGSVPYKLLIELHAVNQRLVSNVRMRPKNIGVVPPTNNATVDDPDALPTARIVLEITLRYHNKTQLSEHSEQLTSSPHNLLAGYAHGARQLQPIDTPDAFQALPVDDRQLLQQLLYVVHHMHDNMPMIDTSFDERPVKMRAPPTVIGAYNPSGPPEGNSVPHSNTEATTAPTTIARTGSSCNVALTEYRVSFSNLDYVDSDFLSYLTMFMGARITRLTVAPHMMVLKLPESAIALSDEEGNDADTEDECDELAESDNTLPAVESTLVQHTSNKRTAPKRKLQPLCIPSVRLTVYVQHVIAPITQMYGLPDNSATKHLVQQARMSENPTSMHNLNVLAMWSRLTPKRKHTSIHEETDLETDSEDGAHRAKRVQSKR